MSSGIMEKNLPVATELGEGDMVRIVTSAGNSKQIDASQIGGGGNLVLTETVEEIQTRAATTQYLHTLSATYDEMVEVIRNGGILTIFKAWSDDDDGIVTDYIEQNVFTGSMFHVTASTDEDLPVGYYLESPWSVAGNIYNFYSATSDGAMTFTTSVN